MRLRKFTGFLSFSIDPFGDGEMNLLPIQGFFPEVRFEAVPHHASTQVWVRDVSHSGCPPERRCCIRSHHFSLSLRSSRRRCLMVFFNVCIRVLSITDELAMSDSVLIFSFSPYSYKILGQDLFPIWTLNFFYFTSFFLYYYFFKNKY